MIVRGTTTSVHRFVSIVCIMASASACERASSSSPSPSRWTPPQVGQRIEETYDSDTELDATREESPDTHHTKTSHREFTAEVRAVEGENITQLEVKEAAKRTVSDGVLEPQTLSTIVGTMTPAGISIAIDGKIVLRAEQAGLSTDMRQAIEGGPGRKKFWSHPFVLGERYGLTADEVFGVGFGAVTVDVVVRTIDAHAIVFDTETTESAPGNVTLHGTGTWSRSADTDELRLTSDVSYGGRKVGTTRISMHSVRSVASTSPRL